MAQIAYLSILLCLLFHFRIAVHAAKDGFSLELIPTNFTDTEIWELSTQFGMHEASEINQTSRAPVSILAPARYTVTLSIGTGSGKRSYNLLLNIDDPFLWTQCKPCQPCFEQSAEIFDPRLSPTYRKVSTGDSLCAPPLFGSVDGQCKYNYAQISGVLSRESITIVNYPPIPMVPFGCTTQAGQNPFGTNAIHGYLGMDMNPTSFVMWAGQGVFSYCLVPDSTLNSRSFLRFGSDVVPPRNYQTTPIIRTNVRKYFIDVRDVSINGHRMNLPQNTFHINGDSTGGFRLSTGDPRSFMIQPAHTAIANYLIQYFQNLHVPVIDNARPCFRRVPGVERNMPRMTLHLPGNVKFDINSEQLFTITPRGVAFCFAFFPDPTRTILGPREQANKWMKIDIGRLALSFARQNCAQNS